MSTYIESETVELKEKYNNNFVRELVAFLNANGGKIYIGITDGGQVIGAKNIDSTLKQISDCITDQIEPSPRNEVKGEIIYDEGFPVIAITVCKGIRPIYCIKKYGYSSKVITKSGRTMIAANIRDAVIFRWRHTLKSITLREGLSSA